jgi:radical SAM superfamily enzyme YgiQ (UPF0313 family)
VESVTLIAPKSHSKTASELSILTTPLTGLLILATMLRNKGYTVQLYDESIKTPRIERIDSDYILLSAMSATVKRAYELGDYFLEQGKTVFMGGLHASFQPEEALEHCSKVVVGEGENVLFTLMDQTYKETILQGTPVMDLDTLPLPDYHLVQGLSKHPTIVSVCSSRGCPFNCRFCSLKSMFGRKFRSMSTDRIIAYLQQFPRIKNLCFDEPNFTANKQRALDILTQMKEQGIHPKYAWPSVSLDVAQDEKLLKACSDVAEFHFLIGLESINKKALQYYNKKHTPETIKKSLRTIHDYGIKVQGSFIFGSDFDEKTVFQKTVDFCHDNDVDFPGFFPLTPYVGTDIRKDLEQQNRIFTNDWDCYDGAHVVFYPKKMTPLELQEGIISAFEQYYSSKKIVHHLKYRQVFYSIQTLLFRILIERIIRQNQEYLEYLETISTS